jgi:hypothetical protein
MRKAKGKLELQELIDVALEDTSFDDIPRCACPINQFPHTMSTVFCITRCYQPCDNFRSFAFITDRCDDIKCYHDAPCSRCLRKIDEYKVLMRCVKVIFDKRMQDWRQTARLKSYAHKNNRTYKILKDLRDKKNGKGTA